MTRIVLYGTWPGRSTGYGRVMHQMVNIMSAAHMDVHVYGIQKGEAGSVRHCAWPNVKLHEVYRTEEDTNAFGMDGFLDFVNGVNPDVVLVYNSAYVMYHALQRIHDVECKKVAYLDIVYSNPPVDYVRRISDISTDLAVFTFDMAHQVSLITRPRKVHVIRHGVKKYKAIDRTDARAQLGFPANAFVVLNLNRNIPRKRLDVFVSAAAAVLRNIGERVEATRPIIFVVNSQHEVCHDLPGIFRYECRHHELPEIALNHLLILQSSKSDEDLRRLMAAGDIGVTCSDGEGWGLCSHEHAAMGVPQIVSPVGIFPEMFAEGGARFLKPLTHTYDGVKEGGKQLVCGWEQLATEILYMFDMCEADLDRMSGDARRAACKYDYDMMASDLLECIQDCT